MPIRILPIEQTVPPMSYLCVQDRVKLFGIIAPYERILNNLSIVFSKNIDPQIKVRKNDSPDSKRLWQRIGGKDIPGESLFFWLDIRASHGRLQSAPWESQSVPWES